MNARHFFNRVNRQGIYLSLCLVLTILLCSCRQPLLQAPASYPALEQGQLAPAQSTRPIYPKNITVEELAKRIEANDQSYWLIDVRTAEEVAIATIPTSTHIPISQITDGSVVKRIEIERGDRQIILHCYSGVRSRRAQQQLKKVGIATTDLKGGIKAWRQQIDPNLPSQLLP